MVTATLIIMGFRMIPSGNTRILKLSETGHPSPAINTNYIRYHNSAIAACLILCGRIRGSSYAYSKSTAIVLHNNSHPNWFLFVSKKPYDLYRKRVILGPFAHSQKVPISFAMSACLSACTSVTLTGRISVKFKIGDFYEKSVDKPPILLKLDNNNWQLTWRSRCLLYCWQRRM